MGGGAPAGFLTLADLRWETLEGRLFAGRNVEAVIELLRLALLEILFEEEAEPAVVAPGQFLHRLVGAIQLRGAVPVTAELEL